MKLTKRSKEAIKDLLDGKSDEDITIERGYSSEKSFRRTRDRWIKREIIFQEPGGFWQVKNKWGAIIHNQNLKLAQAGVIPEIHRWEWQFPFKIPTKGVPIEYIQLIVERWGVDASRNPQNNEYIARMRGVTIRLTSKGLCRVQPGPITGLTDFAEILGKGEKLVRDLIPKIERTFQIKIENDKGSVEIRLKSAEFAHNQSPWAKFANNLGREIRIKVPGTEWEVYTDNSPDETGLSKKQLETNSKMAGKEVDQIDDLWVQAMEGHSMRGNSQDLQILLKLMRRVGEQQAVQANNLRETTAGLATMVKLIAHKKPQDAPESEISKDPPSYVG